MFLQDVRDTSQVWLPTAKARSSEGWVCEIKAQHHRSPSQGLLRQIAIRFLSLLYFAFHDVTPGFDEICGRVVSGEAKTALAASYGISRETLYRYVRELDPA